MIGLIPIKLPIAAVAALILPPCFKVVKLKGIIKAILSLLLSFNASIISSTFLPSLTNLAANLTSFSNNLATFNWSTILTFPSYLAAAEAHVEIVEDNLLDIGKCII